MAGEKYWDQEECDDSDHRDKSKPLQAASVGFKPITDESLADVIDCRVLLRDMRLQILRDVSALVAGKKKPSCSNENAEYGLALAHSITSLIARIRKEEDH